MVETYLCTTCANRTIQIAQIVQTPLRSLRIRGRLAPSGVLYDALPHRQHENDDRGTGFARFSGLRHHPEPDQVKSCVFVL